MQKEGFSPGGTRRCGRSVEMAAAWRQSASHVGGPPHAQPRQQMLPLPHTKMRMPPGPAPAHLELRQLLLLLVVALRAVPTCGQGAACMAGRWHASMQATRAAPANPRDQAGPTSSTRMPSANTQQLTHPPPLPPSPWNAEEEMDLALPNRCCARPGPSSAGFLAAAEAPPYARLPPNAGPLSAGRGGGTCM